MFHNPLEKFFKIPILKGIFRDQAHLEKAMKQGETLPMHPIPKLLHFHSTPHVYTLYPTTIFHRHVSSVGLSRTINHGVTLSLLL